MDYIPDEFKDVKVGIFEKGICSPDAPSANWKGVIIAAPEIVHLEAGKKPQIPVCGYYLLSVVDMMEAGPIKIILKRTGEKESIIGIVGPTSDMEDDPEEPPPEDAPVHSPEELENVYTGGYFNIDAQKHLEVPLSTGTYELTVEYAKSVSNVVVFKLKMY